MYRNEYTNKIRKITGYYHNAIYKNSDTGKSNLIITGGEISGRIYSHNTDKIIIEGGILENVECSNINSAQIKMEQLMENYQYDIVMN